MELKNVFDNGIFDSRNGLTEDMAKARAASGFGNYVKNKTSKSYLKIFADNLLSVFNLLGLLCFVALISVGAEHLSNYAFVIIYSFNIVIGIVQEIRAKRTVDRLSLVKAPNAVVIRSGEKKEIPVDAVVIDDLICLKIGDQIPADCILTDGCVETDESLLTGESVTVKKQVGDQLLSGSFVMSGSCYAKVEGVGENSYVRKLTKKAKSYRRARSELLTSAMKIIKMVGALILPIAALTALVQLKSVGPDAKMIVTATTSVIIGMIPVGMIFLLTLALAVGIIKLASHNTLVQDMYSLESLAHADTLCLDKTGTITDGKMNVYGQTVLDASVDVTKVIASMQAALGEQNQTANALSAYFKSDCLYSAEKTLPFSSARKYSAVELECGTFAVGAPEYLLKGNAKVDEIVFFHTSSGRRTLILVKTDGIGEDAIFGNVTPVAVIVLEDNVRPQAITTIKWFKDNGVAVKVISGDDALTVSKIAERAGVDGADRYVSLQNATEEEVISYAKEYNVFGRVSPEQKAVLIRALKSDGKTVAMTGDGVNDILAMKEADCAISVASGSPAAKQLSHIVLLDDNFDSMPKVVKEGRRVINNIQQSSSLYLMKTLFTIVFAVISIVTLSPYPFNPGMILPLEFIIIGLPSFFLSLQPNDAIAKGKFTYQVFSNAIPSALILVMNALIARYAFIFGVDVTGIHDSLIVFALVFGGYVCLFIMCQPLNNYRFYLIAGILVLIIVILNFADFTLFGSTVFPFPALRINTDWQALLFILALVAVDIPIFYGFDVLTKKLGFKVNLNGEI